MPSSSPLAAATSSNVEKVRIPLPPGAVVLAVGGWISGWNLPPRTRDQIRQAPKVLLHDHLDGGLRPATIVELAAEVGHELPATDAESLGRWFAESADSGSLERYLETFDHTVAVMQTARGADPGRAGVRRGPGRRRRRLRRGPLRARAAHRRRAVARRGGRGGAAGFDEGTAAAGGRIVVRQLLTAMRHQARSMEIAELAVA